MVLAKFKTINLEEIDALYVLTHTSASSGEVFTHTPKVFTSVDSAKAALVNEYQSISDRNDLFENDIDEESLSAYIITEDDECEQLEIHKVNIEG